MVKIRQATKGDYKKIVDFHNGYYSSLRTLEKFYWEFHDSPFGPSLYYIAEDGNKIIATNSLIPIEIINAKGENILTAKSEDSLLHPDYWGQPIFYNLYNDLLKKAEEKGMKAVWGFTPARKPFKRLGFVLPFKHSQSLIVNRITPSYKFISGLNPNNKIFNKIKILGFCTLSKLNALKTKRLKPSTEFHISREETTKDINELVMLNLQKHENLFAIHQTPEYVKWRIYDNPNFFKKHTFAIRNSQNELWGIIIYNSHPNRVAYVSNCIFHPDFPENQIHRMIRYSSMAVFREGVDLIRNWHFNHSPVNSLEMKNFEKSGYTMLDRGIDFVWKDIKPSGLNPTDFVLSRMATQGVI